MKNVSTLLHSNNSSVTKKRCESICPKCFHPLVAIGSDNSGTAILWGCRGCNMLGLVEDFLLIAVHN